MATILVADDEHAICLAFERILKGQGHAVITAASAEDAMEKIAASAPAAVFLDNKLPGQTGLEALPLIRDRWPDIPVIMMTAYGSVDTASQALDSGAFDYLGKPVDLSQIRRVLSRALRPPEQSDASSAERVHQDALVGTSAIMQETFKMLSILSGNDLTALISGERGVGKELAARTIHMRSDRAGEDFLFLDCASTPDPVIAAALFGSPQETSPPALAQPGTLLLKDVFALSAYLQSRLARALQDKRFVDEERDAQWQLTARIIATSDPRSNAASAHDDLYHQLSLLNLTVPPLRARLDDLPVLIKHFIARANVELDKSVSDYSDACLEHLTAHHWPGNVAELEQVITRAVLLAHGTRLSPPDLQIQSPSPEHTADAYGTDDIAATSRRALRRALNPPEGETAPDRPFYKIVEQVEQALIDEALAQADGNQVAASESLGISRTTLRSKKGQ